MNSLSNLLDSETISDHQIKMSLLEVEFEVLAKALVGLPKNHQELFFRNTAYSAKKQLTKLLDSYKKIGEEEVKLAQNNLCEIIDKNISQAPAIELPSTKDSQPLRIETRNKHEIFASLLDISQKVTRDGLPSLENTMNKINDSYLENFVMKKGLEYVLAGRNATTSKNLMENLKKAMLANIEEHLDMILDGIEQIQQGHSAKELVKILKNYL